MHIFSLSVMAALIWWRNNLSSAVIDNIGRLSIIIRWRLQKMKSTYKEKVVKPPSTAQLTKIATELGYDLGQDEIQEYKG